MTGNTAASSPFDSVAAELLDLVDVIRDPLYGDIRVTELERRLIDTPDFQRLRRINQLGLAHLVYPGATHTRFLHSVGTLYVCSRMIETCNRNATTYRRLAPVTDPHPVPIEAYCQLLSRLCSLLHDTAHVPFGHILDKEGHAILDDEWKDKVRVENLFGSNQDAPPYGRIGDEIIDFFQDKKIDESVARRLRLDVRAILSADRESVWELPYPFIHDMTGNTICSDLIDYVQRDSYFCGLEEAWGRRFLQYLAIMLIEDVPSEGSKRRRLMPVCLDRSTKEPAFRSESSTRGLRLVLLQYRYNEQRTAVVKRDVVSEAIDLVRRRAALTSKVYFHRTKMAADAMLVRAYCLAQQSRDPSKPPKTLSGWLSGPDGKHVRLAGDNELLQDISVSKSDAARALANRIESRTFPKAIYRATFHPRDDSYPSRLLWDPGSGAYERFKDPRSREALCDELESALVLATGHSLEDVQGSVVVSCPDEDMNLKAFEMLVLPNPSADLRELQDTEDPIVTAEISAIIKFHRNLWKIEVLVDPNVVAVDPAFSVAQTLAGVIQHRIGPPNEVEGFARARAMDLDEWLKMLEVDQALTHLGVADQITSQDKTRVLQEVHRTTGAKIGMDDQVRQALEKLGKYGFEPKS